MHFSFLPWWCTLKMEALVRFCKKNFSGISNIRDSTTVKYWQNCTVSYFQKESLNISIEWSLNYTFFCPAFWLFKVDCLKEVQKYIVKRSLAWPLTILKNDNITISWDFFRLPAPRCPSMAAGAVSLGKSRDIIILSFCNIVKGQAIYQMLVRDMPWGRDHLLSL